eukprot:5102238-Pleurochrysis_carterae.AAC.4
MLFPALLTTSSTRMNSEYRAYSANLLFRFPSSVDLNIRSFLVSLAGALFYASGQQFVSLLND